MEFIYIVSSIISLITLIYFFIMAFNIGVIKRQLAPRSEEKYLSEYRKHDFWNDRELAIKSLKEAYWCQLTEINKNPPEYTKEQIERLNIRYKILFDNYNIAIPVQKTLAKEQI